MTKIRIGISTWQRPELTKLVLAYYSALKIPDIEFDFVIVDSENNDYSHLGLTTIHHENYPVSDKHNYGAEYFRTKGAFDWFINIGSDDLISPGYFRLLATLTGNVDFVEYRSIYFYDLKDRAGFSGRFNAGTARAMSYKFMELCDFKPWHGEPKNRLIDSMVHHWKPQLRKDRILTIDESEFRTTPDDLKFRVVDIKGGGANIWDYEQAYNSIAKWSITQRSPAEVFNIFPPEVLESINKLSDLLHPNNSG